MQRFSQHLPAIPTISPKFAIIVTSLIAFVLFVSTLQVDINGITHPYTTDVGEIQNALPRWGTLHFTGYPLYTALGSAFVTLLRPFGIAPAAGASLYSAVWGAISIGLLVAITLSFEVPPLVAGMTALLFALSTSMWVDSSIAELHTMTMALSLAALLAAIRFGRRGEKRDLYGLAFLCGQGIAHQRSFAFLGLGILLFVMPQWRAIWKSLPVAIGWALLGPLTYLYLPLRAWLGAEWLFSSPGTWDGFWKLVLDTKVDRIVSVPQSGDELWLRLDGVWQLLADDWPWPLLLIGLFGLLLANQRVNWRERLALSLSWLPYLVLSLIIWEGQISDALLAVKMPIVALAALGLAFIRQIIFLPQRLKSLYHIVIEDGARWVLPNIVLFIMLIILYGLNKPTVLEITQHQGAQETIALAEQLSPASDGRPTTLMTLWGNDYWQLAYVQAYQNQLPHLNLVDHNANLVAIVEQEHHLMTLSRTFYERPLEWWQQTLGSVHLSSVAPGVIEISQQPQITSNHIMTSLREASTPFVLGNGIIVREANLTWRTPDTLLLTVDWEAEQNNLPNYSVAIHLVTQNPPTGPQDIAAQADSAHPVDGWYPTSRWAANEVVRDHYLLTVPPDSAPSAVRIGMYQQLEDGQFKNSEWLSLPVPTTAGE